MITGVSAVSRENWDRQTLGRVIDVMLFTAKLSSLLKQTGSPISWVVPTPSKIPSDTRAPPFTATIKSTTTPALVAAPVFPEPPHC